MGPPPQIPAWLGGHWGSKGGGRSPGPLLWKGLVEGLGATGAVKGLV